jgi:hypothetical protein
MKATITKSYFRRLSAGAPHYTSEEFSTRLEKEIEYNTKEEFLAETDKLALQVKSLTVRDMEKYSEVIKLSRPNNPVQVEETV